MGFKKELTKGKTKSKPKKEKPEKRKKRETRKTTDTKGKPKKDKKPENQKQTDKDKGSKSINNQKMNTRLRVLLIIGTVIVISLIIALIVLAIIKPPENTDEKSKKNVCDTPECLHLAHRLHNWKDPTVDPCDDFFKYTCGRYTKDITKGDQLDFKTTIVTNLMKAFLHNDEKPTLLSETLMKMLFQKCETTSQRFDEQGVLNKISEIGPSSLIDDNWNPANFDLNEMLINLGKITKMHFGLFELAVEFTKQLAVAGPRPIDIAPALVKMQSMLERLRRHTQASDRELFEVKDLIERIERASAQDNSKVEIASFDDLKRAVPSVNFERIFKSVLETDRVKWDQVRQNKIVVWNQDFFFGQKDTLQKIIDETPNQVLANMFKFVYVNFAIERNATTYDCVKSMPQAAHGLLIRKYIDPENTKLVSEMVDAFNESYVQMFKESTWLSEGTKQNAIRKMKGMQKMVGYPEGYLESMEQRYQTLDLHPGDSLTTINTKLYKFNVEDNIEYLLSGSLFLPVNHGLLTANAVYNRLKNRLTIYTPIFDDPAFDSSFPMYAKLAGAGVVVAHEIGHGFDSISMNYDANGVMKDWWEAKDRKEYQKRFQCLVDQYDNYDDPDYGRNLNGKQTRYEMIADQLGAKANWLTHKRIGLSNDANDLIGFEGYDKDRLFFQIAASVWCETPRTLPLNVQLQFVHATNSFRVNGVFSNMREFAEAYNCPLGSTMNPEKKCELF